MRVEYISHCSLFVLKILVFWFRGLFLCVWDGEQIESFRNHIVTPAMGLLSKVDKFVTSTVIVGIGPTCSAQSQRMQSLGNVVDPRKERQWQQLQRKREQHKELAGEAATLIGPASVSLLVPVVSANSIDDGSRVLRAMIEVLLFFKCLIRFWIKICESFRSFSFG
jgi:hypothetical protein